MRKSSLIILIAFITASLIASFTLFGCAQEEVAEAAAAPAEEAAEEAVGELREGPVKIAWMPKGLGHPFGDFGFTENGMIECKCFYGH